LTWSDFPKHSVIKKLVYMSEHLKSEMDNVQKSRTEAHNAQALLDMKRTFVRYVSHEIRTPLNTVSMGLKLIQHLKPNHAEVDDDAKKRSHDSDSSCVLTDGRQRPDGTVVGRVDENVFDMADEIKESCDIAINILNDLLLYEKMEGGLLALERQREPALSLILEVTP
jgi:signal transduction histidine kinase